MSLTSAALIFCALVSFFASPARAVETNAACPTTPMSELQATPEGLKVWLQTHRNQVVTPDQLICCLPEVYRKNYLIAPNSQAGQNGSPESPRVLLHPSLVQHSKGNQAIFSINGGASYLNNTQNVEMAFFRAQNERLEYIDIDFSSGKYAPLKTNPKQCMQCHGLGDGGAPAEGPRPIFDPFGHWPRFVGGALKCNPAEDQLQLKAQRRALQAVRDNPRFRCLDRSQIDVDLAKLKLREAPGLSVIKTGNENLSGFDSYLMTVNMKRVARLIRKTVDYDAYKFLIVGSEKCNLFTALDEWIPMQVIAKHTNLSTISSDVTGIQTPEQMQALLQKKKALAIAAKRRMKQRLAVKNFDEAQPIEVSQLPLMCDGDSLNDTVNNLPTLMGYFPNTAFRAFYIDQLLRTPPLQIRGSISPLLRFIFEGRGISMAHWSEDAVLGEYRTGGEIMPALLESEPRQSRLRQILALEETTEKEVSRTERETLKRKVCDGLREASFEALSRRIPAAVKAASKLKVNFTK